MKYKIIIILLTFFSNSFSQQTLTSNERELFNAVSENNANKIAELYDHQTDINVKNEDGNTPLILAVFKGYLTIVKQLLAYPEIDIYATGLYNKTAFEIAKQYKKHEISQEIIKHPGFSKEKFLRFFDNKKTKEFSDYIEEQINVLASNISFLQYLDDSELAFRR